ncbi:hypothetical protein [Helicobacter pylori]|nr:hypothetical protein [Helicobacter pylori]
MFLITFLKLPLKLNFFIKYQFGAIGLDILREFKNETLSKEFILI